MPKFPKGGRPRLAGAREASGRLSRRHSEQEKDVRMARAYWRELLLFNDVGESRGHRPEQDHCLLNLLKLDKISAGEFIIALYWAAATDPALAARWPKRTFLTKKSG